MIAAGNYPARARSDAALGETSTGKEQVAVTLDILDWETRQPTGGNIVWYGYFTEAAVEHTLRSLRRMGWQGNDFDDLSTIGTKDVMIEVIHETYENKTRAKIKWINDMDGGGAVLKTPLTGDKAKFFAARMKSTVAAFDASEGKPRVSGSTLAAAKRKNAGPPEPPPHTEDDMPDDIPF